MDQSNLPVEDLFEQPVADDPDPAKRAGAAADYIECSSGISNGGWSQDFGPPEQASSPDGALERFLDANLFALPGDGYNASGRDTDRWLYTYSADGMPKVAVIVAATTDVGTDGSAGWTVETYATCDPAEYDSSVDDQLSVDVWLDPDGNRVLTSIVTSFQGSGHCGWESVTFLVFADRPYVGDPRGVIKGVDFVGPFEGDTDLPADAVSTGYSHDGRELWMSADETVAYMVTVDGVEAWPSPTQPVGCA